MNRYYSRIDAIDNIDILSKKVCLEYNLGQFLTTTVIEIGYEDFNAIIETINGKYVMKVFRNSRSDNEAYDCIYRTERAGEIGVNTPKVYHNSQGAIMSVIRIKDSRFKLALIEYIDGKDFFTMQEKPSIAELSAIVEIASKLSLIDYMPSPIYDPWSIYAFLEEFKKKWKYLSSDQLALIEPIEKDFRKFNEDGRYQLLPKSFVHGDMMSTNLMRDKNGKIWLIDFSVSNYTVRLHEIVVICDDVALVKGKKDESEKRIRYAFTEWCSKVKATGEEREAFPLLFSVANAINVMNSSYEISNGNNSPETKMHLEMGLFGLSLFK